MSADVFAKLAAYLSEWFGKLMAMIEQTKAWFDANFGEATEEEAEG